MYNYIFEIPERFCELFFESENSFFELFYELKYEIFFYFLGDTINLKLSDRFQSTVTVESSPHTPRLEQNTNKSLY